MGLNLPRETAKFGRPARIKHCQYQKMFLLNLNQTRTRATLFQSITDVSTTALSRITFKSYELKNSNNSYHAARLSCQLP